MKNGSESQEAFERLVSQLHNQLKRAAHNRRAEFPFSTLQTTELLNEAFLRLIPIRGRLSIENREHFINLISCTIKKFLLEELRQRKTVKRGGDFQLVALDESNHLDNTSSLENDLSIMEAMENAREEDPQLYKIVQCRHFCGFTIEETSKMLGIPKVTVNRKWAFAKVWLFDKLSRRNP